MPDPVIYMLIILLGGVVLGFPIAISLLLACLPPLLIEPRLSLVMVAQRSYNTLDSFILLAVPFFLLAGNLMNSTGVTDRLIKLADATVGHFQGGLAQINIFVSMMFAGVSGSSTADTAGVGSVLIPAMKRKGYSAEFSVAITAASSVMGSIIPPSIILIIWGAVTNTSVAKLFAGGILPGIMIGLSQMIYVSYRARKEGLVAEPRQTWLQRAIALRGAMLGILLPIIMVGGIMLGLATPTEASILAVVYALLLGFLVYRILDLRSFWAQLADSARLVSLSLFCVASAGLFGWLLSYYRVPLILASVTGDIASPVLLLTAIAVICLILGTFLDAMVVAIIVGPLFLPSVLEAGIDPVQFGLVACVSLSLGLITPPYGLCLLLAASIGELPMHKALPEAMKLFGIMIGVLILIILLPFLTLAPAALI